MIALKFHFATTRYVWFWRNNIRHHRIFLSSSFPLSFLNSTNSWKRLNFQLAIISAFSDVFAFSIYVCNEQFSHIYERAARKEMNKQRIRTRICIHYSFIFIHIKSNMFLSQIYKYTVRARAHTCIHLLYVFYYTLYYTIHYITI